MQLSHISPTSDISIHAAREGGDGFGFCPCRRAERFQSTPPVKAATSSHITCPRYSVFQSTPPVKAATRNIRILGAVLFISIHAAREGGDARSGQACVQGSISIHAAREGGDPRDMRGTACCYISIHAAREGGDFIDSLSSPCSSHFNPRRP